MAVSERQDPFWNSTHNLLRPRGPSTRVTIFFEPGELLVFFSNRTTLDAHEDVISHTTSSIGRLGCSRFAVGRLASGYLRMGGHFWKPTASTSWRLLLWLRPIEDRGRLHQDVRAPQVCFAVVGCQLRQASRKRASG